MSSVAGALWLASYNRNSAIGLGTTEILLGLFSVVFGVQGILTHAALHYIGFGIWGGALSLVTGSVAVASRNPSQQIVSATMSLAIISSLTSLAQTVLAGFGVYINYEEIYCGSCVNGTFCTRWLTDICIDASELEHARFAGITVAATGFLQICIGIPISTLGCGLCVKVPQNQVHPEELKEKTLTGCHEVQQPVTIILQMPPSHPPGTSQQLFPNDDERANPILTEAQSHLNEDGMDKQHIEEASKESQNDVNERPSHINGEPPDTLKYLTHDMAKTVSAMDPQLFTPNQTHGNASGFGLR